MKRWFGRPLACAAFVAGVAWAQAAQQQAPQQTSPAPTPIERRTPDFPTIKVETRLVSVALNVVDEHGAPVSGITRDDVEIFEDGKPVKIAVFDKESVTPLAIVFAVDASESVYGEDRLERDAAKDFAKSILRTQDRIDLMSFADAVDEVVGFTNDPKRFDEGLGHIQKGDATALYDAIYLASQRLGQTSQANGERRVIVVLSDGENTTHHGSYPAALEEAQRTGAMIYSLIIVPVQADAGRDTGGEHALIQLSRDTGGKFYYVSDKHDLVPAFEHVSDDLRTQYTLGYYAPHRALNQAGLRHITVQMKDPALREKYKLRYRTAYYADR